MKIIKKEIKEVLSIKEVLGKLMKFPLTREMYNINFSTIPTKKIYFN